MNKTQTIMNRIVQVDNFQNMACCCANWKEFVQELAESGVDGCAKIDYDDKELDEGMLMQSIAFVEELREKFFKFTIEKKGGD